MASVGALYPSQVANSSVIVGIREEKRSSITLCESIDIIGITNEEITSAKSGNTKPNALTLLRKSDCASFLRSGVPSAARIVLTEAIGAYSILLTEREKAVGLLPLFVKRRLFS
jgi:predicted methyltransferase MtxX (methanogen marker protein 4)